MTAAGNLVVNLAARTAQFQKGMSTARKHLGRLVTSSTAAGAATARMGRAVVGTFGTMGTAAKSLWTSLAPVIAPLIGVYGFIRLASAGEMFNRTMRGALAIMGDVSNMMKTKMRAAAFAVAGDLGFAASEMGKGFYYLQSAGLSVEKQLVSLRPAAEFARAGMFDLARATELLAGSQAAMGMKSENTAQHLKNMTRVSDVLVKANTLANATVEEFATALGTDAANAARMAGQDIEDVVGVLAAFAEKMVKGEKAGTSYARAINYLSVQAVDNQAEFERSGVAMFDLNGKTRKLVDVIADLEKRFAGMSDRERTVELQTLGFSKKTIALMNTLIGTSSQIRNFTKQLHEAGGTTAEVAQKQLTPFQRGMGKLGASLTEVSSSIVSDVSPAIGTVIGLFADMIKECKGLVTWSIKIGGSLLILTGVIYAISGLMKLWALRVKIAAAAQIFLQAVSGPAGWAMIAAGIVVATGAIVAMNVQLGEAAEHAQDAARNAGTVPPPLEEISKQKNKIDALTGSVKELGNSLGEIPAVQSGIVTAASNMQTAMVSALNVMRETAAAPKEFLTERAKLEKEGARALGYSAVAVMPLEVLPAELVARTGKLRQELERMSELPGSMGQRAAESLEGLNRVIEDRWRLARLAEQMEEKTASGMVGTTEEQQRMTEASQQFIRSMEQQYAGLQKLRESVATLGAVFASDEEASRFLQKSLESLVTPAEKFADVKEKLAALRDVGELDSEQFETLATKAMEDFDAATGGAKKKIQEMAFELVHLNRGSTEAEIALDRLRIAGAKLADIELLRWQEKERAKFKDMFGRKEEAEQMAKQFQAPAEKVRQEIDRINARAKEFPKIFSEGMRARAVAEAEGKGAIDKDQGPQYAKALERGSAEAYSRILAASRSEAKPMEEVAKSSKATAKETRRGADILQDLRDNVGEPVEIGYG